MRLAILILVALVGIASAQNPDKETKQKAAAHFKQGKAYYDAKQWDRAIAEYEDAWALIQQPLLQFNIALALEQKGDLAGALEHFERYLELEPSGAVSDEAREDVARLAPKVEAMIAAAAEAKRLEEERLEAEAAEAERLRLEKERADAEQRQRGEEEQRRKDAEAKRLQAETDAAARAAARARAAPMRRRSRVFRWSGYGAVAIAAVAGVGAVFAGKAAAGSADLLETHREGPWTDELLAEQARGRSSESRMWLATGIATGSLVVGGVLIILGRSMDHRAESLERVSITAGPGGVGLAIGGAW